MIRDDEAPAAERLTREQLERTARAGERLVGGDAADLDLRGADLAGLDVRGGTWAGARLDGADLTDARFTEVDLQGVTAPDALLADTRFERCRLTGAQLAHPRGLGFILRGGTAFGADLSGTCLRENFFEGTRLTEAVLRGADLRGARLDGCDLLGADLHGARLDGADLRAARVPDDLALADLEGAVLTPAQVARLVAAQLGIVVLEG
ncbi:Pentapeptide repeat-containing protein [Kytococcus aerolatus]|uniref:Pentapeptide repeat-containing protein n=1 Tax=Kytococcus aerolatus TaxID=592308 RepID=A0A212T6B6_9MICO|nr:pentapeptide repeat-containing protein [Kytococcus aerolatus]SNC61578.1 Pentapeptide repeat-containing protein [Kytococcus aerolatus]